MIKNIKITQIVAFDSNQAIGKNNELAWHIPTDLAHFSKKTSNGIILMGRKTFDSIGRILPRRQHIVISRDEEQIHPPVYKINSIDKALDLAVQLAVGQNINEIFIIGGAEIYKQTLDKTDAIIATKVGLSIDGADAFYPQIPTEFKLVSSLEDVDPSTKINLTFLEYART